MSVLKQAVVDLLQQAGVHEAELSVPPKPDMGDFAFACFALAKKSGKNPAEIAKELAGKLDRQKPPLVEKVAALGPYVNFYLEPAQAIALVVEGVTKNKSFGSNTSGKGKKVLIEYPSNNTHK